MGPSNIALVKLFEADQALRAAQARLEAATKDVRVQERRVRDLDEKLKLAQQRLKELQAKAHNGELDLKSRDGHIERLRSQQQSAKTNREYQAFLIEINTHKVDRAKIEDETMKLLEQAEKTAGEVRDLEAQRQTEHDKAEQMKANIGQTVSQLQAEIEALKPAREQAASTVPPKALITFERMADRYDGEPMAAIQKPHPRREEYICTACNMELVIDVYNRLHSRDDMVTCPSCQRLLYIPEDLTPDIALGRKKEKEPKAPRAPKEPKAPRAPRGATKTSSGHLWTEKEFHAKVTELDRPRLQPAQAQLLERLRSSGIENVDVVFDVRGGDIPAYNVYVRGLGTEVLRVQADGAYRANWQGFVEANQQDLVLFTQQQFTQFLRASDAPQSSWQAEGKTLVDIDPDQLASAMFEVATRAAQAGVTAG